MVLKNSKQDYTLASNNDRKFHLQCPLHEVGITTTLVHVQVVIVAPRMQQQGQLAITEPEGCTVWPFPGEACQARIC